MVDFAMDVFRQLYHDKEVPKELRDKRVTVVSELKSLQSAVVPITRILAMVANSSKRCKKITSSNQNISTSSTTLPSSSTSAATTPEPPSTSISTGFWRPRVTKTS